MADPIELGDVKAFRQYKHRADGVIVMRRSGSGTSVHHPACPFVTEDSFVEKQAYGGDAGYYWAESLAEAKARWPLAHVCGHPSDPLAGGPGGPDASRVTPPSEPRSGHSW